MGIDFLDLNFRIEKRFGIRIPLPAWEQITSGRKKFDLTAGEVCDIVQRFLADLPATPARSDPVEDRQVPVPTNDKRQQGSIRPVFWFVSKAFRKKPTVPIEPIKRFEGDVWPEIQLVISDTIGIPVCEIEKDKWLVRDLGME